jgi:hypothetical protein
MDGKTKRRILRNASRRGALGMEHIYPVVRNHARARFVVTSGAAGVPLKRNVLKLETPWAAT